jgi:hypothetical protein
MLIGLLVLALGVVRTPWMLGLTITVSCISGIWTLVYSYLVYRKDPHRISPAGTSPSVE